MRKEKLVILVLYLLGFSQQSYFDEFLLGPPSSSSSVSMDDEDSYEIPEPIILPKPPLSPRPTAIDPERRLIFQIEDEHYEIEHELEPFVTTSVRDDQNYSAHLFLRLSSILSDLTATEVTTGSAESRDLYSAANESVEMAWSLRDYAKDGTKLMRRIDDHIYKLDQHKAKLVDIIASYERIQEESYREKVKKRIERVKATQGTAGLALQALVSVKQRYAILLRRTALACMSSLLTLFNEFEAAVAQLSSQVDEQLDAQPVNIPEVEAALNMYGKSHSGYHRVRAVIAGLSSSVEGISSKGVLLRPMLHDRASNFKSRLEFAKKPTCSPAGTVLADSSTSTGPCLEDQIGNILAIADAKAPDDSLSVYDVYSKDFDYEKYRLEFLHHAHLDDGNFVGDSDPVFKRFLAQTLSRRGSPAVSPMASEESEGSNDDDDDFIGKILRDFKRMSAEEFATRDENSCSSSSSSSSSSEDFHLLMGLTWLSASEMPDALLVNPDSCPHGSSRQKMGKTLISPPVSINSCIFLTDQAAAPTDPESTGRSYSEVIANLKGLRELRSIIVDQFVTAIRMKAKSIIVGRFGCAGCGVHLGQVAAIYSEVATLLKGHSLTQVYFSDPELFSALSI